MKHLTAIILISILVATGTRFSFARSISDWNIVKASVGKEVYLLTKNKTAHFGILRSADDNEVTLQIATKENLDTRTTAIDRNEILKIREARLRFDGRRWKEGALIGAAVGAGAGLATVAARRNEGDGQVSLAVPVFALYGAGAGALAGYFVKKGHKKGKTIYSV